MAKRLLKNKNLSLWIAIIGVAVLAVGVGVGAFSGTATTVIENVQSMIVNNDSQGFGARQSDIASGFYDVYVENDLTVDGDFAIDGGNGIALGTTGSDSVVTDGYVEKVVVIDLTNTSSATLVNPEDETIYVYDATFRIQTATTSAFRAVIGTSSASVIAIDGSCLATGCDDTTSGNGSILDTGDVSASTAANTTYFKADYQGVDTRDASGVRYLVPVNDDEYLSVFASTTLNITPGTFAAQAQIKYYVIED